jgi:hypothetical protein
MINKNRHFENASHDLTFYDARNQTLEILLKKKKDIFFYYADRLHRLGLLLFPIN